MSITTIKDTRIRVRPSKALLKLIAEHQEEIVELPENLMKVMKRNGYELTETKVEILSESNVIKPPTIDKQLLQELTKDLKDEKATEIESNEENEKEKDEATLAEVHESYLYLNDLRWLNQFLTKLRNEKSLDIYLHSLLDKCALELPENEKIERNPELEARCQKLREQQQNLEYYKMTKNVDAQLKHYPEDTVAYQMKAINGQVIAVFQFVVSVMAGFAFGFLGVGWIIGDLDFGFRLLLGVMCALVIALAEIYFLAKKLVEYDTAVDAPRQTGSPIKHPKMHKD